MAEKDKLFEFMTKIHSELQSGFKIVNARFDNIEDEISSIKQELKKIGAKIDGDLIPNQKALFDGHTQNTEILFRDEEDIDLLKNNVSDINGSLSEMKEDINFIAGKAIRNDSKLEKLNNHLKLTR